MKDKTNQVVCNKADNERCQQCGHHIVHKPEERNGVKCTTWMECIGEDHRVQYKTRCIKVR